MRRALVLAVAVLLVSGLFSSTTAAVGPRGVLYSFDGCHGMLSVANAAGQWMSVFDSHGLLIVEGPVPSEYLHMPCPNHGPDEFGVLLRIRIEDVQFSIDRAQDWNWEF